MNFHTFTVAVVYFFVIIIIHVLIKNNINSEYNINSEHNINSESEYDTDYYSDNDLVFDLDTIDNLKKETVERTNKGNINDILYCGKCSLWRKMFSIRMMVSIVEDVCTSSEAVLIREASNSHIQKKCKNQTFYRK